MVRAILSVPRWSPHPSVLTATASQVSWSVDATGDLRGAWEALEVPPELDKAVAARKLQYRIGRFCATQAIRTLDPQWTLSTIPRGRSGAPVWPPGIIGSITHTSTLVSAAVARTRDVAALGIDTERIPDGHADSFAAEIGAREEFRLARATGCTRAEAFTLLFSAKESLFKCLYPLVGTYFHFHDVRIEAIDGRAGTFVVRLLKALAEDFPAQTVLGGRFECDGTLVHTGIALAARN